MISTLTLLGSALPRKNQVLASLCPERSQVLAPLPKSWYLYAKTWPLENLRIRPDGLWGFGTGAETSEIFKSTDWCIYNFKRKRLRRRNNKSTVFHKMMNFGKYGNNEKRTAEMLKAGIGLDMFG